MKKPVKVLAVTSLLATLTVSGVANAAVDPFAGTPSTEAPTTEAPTTEAPTTEAPTTEAPNTRELATPEAGANLPLEVKIVQDNGSIKYYSYNTNLVIKGKTYTHQQIADLVGYKGELKTPTQTVTIPETNSVDYSIKIDANSISEQNEYEQKEYSKVRLSVDTISDDFKLAVGETYTHDQLLKMILKEEGRSYIASNPAATYTVPAKADSLTIPIIEDYVADYTIKVNFSNRTTGETNSKSFYLIAKGTELTYQQLADMAELENAILDKPDEVYQVNDDGEIVISYTEDPNKKLYVDYSYELDNDIIIERQVAGTLAPFFVGYKLLEETIYDKENYSNYFKYVPSTGNRLDSLTTEAPTTEAPTTEAPTTEKPTTEAPTTEAPTTEKPTIEGPTTEKPTTEAPTTEEATTEKPTTEAPTTEEATTEKPTTEAPTVEEKTTEDSASEGDKGDKVDDKKDNTMNGSSSSDVKEKGSKAKEENKSEAKSDSKSESKSVLSSVLPQTGEAATGLIAFISTALLAAGSYLVFRRK